MSTVDSLLDTKAGLALATAAWEEGAKAMALAFERMEDGEKWKKPRSPYSSPLIQLTKES